MASKVITISLPEALEWKLDQLSKRTGIPKSVLIQKALLLLVSDLATVSFHGGEFGADYSLHDIEQEYDEREDPPNG